MSLELEWLEEIAALDFAKSTKPKAPATSKVGKKLPNCSKGWGPCGYRCLPHTAKNCPSALEGQAKSLAEWLEKSAAITSSKPDTATPKKTAKTEKTAKAKTVDSIADFPDRLDELKTVKSLGGSTGAVLVQDPATGQQYVMKRGNSPEHIREEVAADAAYEALGVNVPRHRLYETDSGPVKLAEYIDGSPLSDLTASDRANVNQELQKNFAADALLGNWDVVGLDEGNVLLGKDGKVYRIDNGGSLRYRAQGAEKGEAWNDYPTELWSMRDASINATAANAFGGLKHFDMVEQLEAIAGREEALLKALPQDLHQTIKARLSEMKRVAEVSRTLESDQWNESYTSDFTKHMVGIRDAGITDKLPDVLKQKGKSKGVTLYDKDGNEFDSLRDTGSTMVDVRDYINRAGGEYAIAEEWMAGQAGSSWSGNAQAFKWHMANQRNKPVEDAYYWHQGMDGAKSQYEDRIKKWGKARYDQTLAAWHAWNYELLSKTKLPNKNDDGTITLLRTEDSSVMKMNGFNVGDKDLIMKRGAAESTSLVKSISVMGNELTSQRVPIHRIFGTYLYERSPEMFNDAFYGDEENEFVAMLDDVPFDYVKGKKSTKSKKAKLAIPDSEDFEAQNLFTELMKLDSDILGNDPDWDEFLKTVPASFKKKL